VKFATIESGNGSTAIAVISEDDVWNLGPLLHELRLPWRDLGDVLTEGPAALRKLAEIAESAQRSTSPTNASAVTFLSPVPRPAHVIAVAANYADHVKESDVVEFASPDETSPWLFNKPQSSINPHRSPIILPATIGEDIDWEAELGVVMGARAQAVSRENALDYVAGYTIVNDLSARRMTLPERTRLRDRDRFYDWLHGKWFDTFCCVGPWMTTADEIPDPGALDIALSVNSTVYQKASTGQMVFDVPRLISFISNIVTLEPGDIIATGTPSGTGKSHGRYLRDGDQVRVEISQIGVLENPVRSHER